MAAIYESLPSPTSKCLDDIKGWRGKLYEYQRRSVAAMIERETTASAIPDPLFIALRGMNDQEFYLQPATMEILKEHPMVAQNRGGMLCEELGEHSRGFEGIGFSHTSFRNRENGNCLSFGPCYS
jgi:hypothetical protein